MLPKGRRKFLKIFNFQFYYKHKFVFYHLLCILLIIKNTTIISGKIINNKGISKENSSTLLNYYGVSEIENYKNEDQQKQQQQRSSSIIFDNIKDSDDDDGENANQLIRNNPCLIHYCPKGRECILNDYTNQPICICQRHCTQRKRLICGSNGKIYKNHCKLHQASCLLNIPITYQRLEKCLLIKNNKKKQKDHKKFTTEITTTTTTATTMATKLSSTISSSSSSSSIITTEQNTTDLLNNENNNNNDNDNNRHRTIIIFKENDNILEKSDNNIHVNINDFNNLNTNKNNNDNNDNEINYRITNPNISLLLNVDDINKNLKKLHHDYYKKTINHTVNTNINATTNSDDITKNDNDDIINYIDDTIKLDRKQLCTSQEYEIMKDNLLLFNHARLMSQDNNHSKDFLVSIMFSHYDQNNDAYLEIEELNQISVVEHLDELSNGCVLEDMLIFDDLDNDEKLSINEFYQAFSKLYSVSVVSLDKALETNHLSARVGDNVEIKCDVTGSPSPPIIWRRDDVDLSTLNNEDIRVFNDGSLYLTRIQLLHSGNYTCHAQRNKDVVQTHILNVYTIPQVLVMPRIQSKRPGENAEMWCHVTSDPLPKVEWLKNDEKLNLIIPNKYELIGNGTALKIHNIQYSDTGAYMCQATNIGGTVRDISSLVVQEEPTPTVINEERKFFVFHENGVSIYEPSACRLYHQIQSTDIIPGTQEYVCGGIENIKCSWGRAINAGTRYIYASQPELNRILVISTIQMVVIDIVKTDKYPVELYYVQKLDQIWILSWQYSNNVDKKIIQVIREAGQKRKHFIVHPESIDGQYDSIKNLFIPSSELEQPHFSYNYGYVTHNNQRNIYKLDLLNLRYIKSVDLTLYDCVPENIEFSALYGFVILSCREPTTGRPRGQLILDYLTDAILTTKPSLFGIPKISPDSRHLITIQHNYNEAVIVVQKITRNGLEFIFDVKTTLNISDVTFYESQTTHGYDLFAAANDKGNILYLNLCTGKVETITGVGSPLPKSLNKWENPGRIIRSSGLFGLYMLTTGNNALFVINGRARTVNCEIGGIINPTSIVWTHVSQNYATIKSSLFNE